jgi:hypothetical protein
MNSLGLLNRPCLCNASSWLATQYSSSIDPLVGNWSAGDNDNNISWIINIVFFLVFIQSACFLFLVAKKVKRTAKCFKLVLGEWLRNKFPLFLRGKFKGKIWCFGIALDIFLIFISLIYFWKLLEIFPWTLNILFSFIIPWCIFRIFLKIYHGLKNISFLKIKKDEPTLRATSNQGRW